jgi:hypothetical protein
MKNPEAQRGMEVAGFKPYDAAPYDSNGSPAQ